MQQSTSGRRGNQCANLLREAEPRSWELRRVAREILRADLTPSFLYLAGGRVQPTSEATGASNPAPPWRNPVLKSAGRSPSRCGMLVALRFPSRNEIRLGGFIPVFRPQVRSRVAISEYASLVRKSYSKVFRESVRSYWHPEPSD